MINVLVPLVKVLFELVGFRHWVGDEAHLNLIKQIAWKVEACYEMPHQQVRKSLSYPKQNGNRQRHSIMALPSNQSQNQVDHSKG